MPDEPARSIVSVVKLGGSVLIDVPAYRTAAEALAARATARPEERLVVVVSAREGVTDALSALARTLTRRPNPRSLDLLWATGELESVALLTIALQAAGADAIGLSAHELGLRCTNGLEQGGAGLEQGGAGLEQGGAGLEQGGAGLEQGGAGLQPCESISLSGNRLRTLVRDHQIVVVPGFLATDADGALVSLGRGGSDLTAVLLAAELGAPCELVKDVPGYFTTDPNHDRSATPVAALTHHDALVLAAQGCDLVQRRALEAAARADVTVVVRALADQAPRTVVSSGAGPTRMSETGAIATQLSYAAVTS